jgi:hypothetical protein
MMSFISIVLTVDLLCSFPGVHWSIAVALVFILISWVIIAIPHANAIFANCEYFVK